MSNFIVSTTVNGHKLNDTNVEDPFMYHHIRVGFVDLVKILFSRRRLHIVVGINTSNPSLLRKVMLACRDATDERFSVREEKFDSKSYKEELVSFLLKDQSLPVDRGMYPDLTVPNHLLGDPRGIASPVDKESSDG